MKRLQSNGSDIGLLYLLRHHAWGWGRKRVKFALVPTWQLISLSVQRIENFVFINIG